MAGSNMAKNRQNKQSTATISIEQWYIPAEEKRLPQDAKNYVLVDDKKEFNDMFKNYQEIIIRLDENTGYVRHKIHPRIVTYNKDGSISPTRSQTIEVYNEYKQWLVDRFNKKQVYKLKN